MSRIYVIICAEAFLALRLWVLLIEKWESPLQCFEINVVIYMKDKCRCILKKF